MRKKALCLLTALCLAAVFLTGCTRKGGEETAPVPTLAPASVSWEAPDGDRTVGKPGDYRLYVPEKNQAALDHAFAATHENTPFILSEIDKATPNPDLLHWDI